MIYLNHKREVRKNGTQETESPQRSNLRRTSPQERSNQKNENRKRRKENERKNKMKVITSTTKIKLSTEEVRTLNGAYSILYDIQKLLLDSDNTLFTDKIGWEYDEIANATKLLYELARDEITTEE